MQIQDEAVAFTEEAEVRMQELAEFLARKTRINLALVGQLHDARMLLTPGAFLMLVIPLIEAAEDDSVPPSTVRESVGRLLESIKNDPAPFDARFDSSDVKRLLVKQRARLFRRTPPATELGPREHVRSSLSVIRAYWKRYCTIRPYCEGDTRSS